MAIVSAPRAMASLAGAELASSASASRVSSAAASQLCISTAFSTNSAPTRRRAWPGLGDASSSQAHRLQLPAFVCATGTGLNSLAGRRNAPGASSGSGAASAGAGQGRAFTGRAGQPALAATALQPAVAEAQHVRQGDAKDDSKLRELRGWMQEASVDAFVVPSDDPHLSEYAAECFNRREYISGFTGSAGTVVVTQDKALLWTDGRYFLQAEKELGPGWTLMRAGQKKVPSIKDWLADNLAAGARVGVDPFVHSAAFANELAEALKGKSKQLVPLEHSGEANPVDHVWGPDRPHAPQAKVRVHPMKYAGQTSADKIAKLRQKMEGASAGAFVVCMLDEVAWLLNIRGGDVDHCPVTLSYAVVTPEGAKLFVDLDKLSPEVEAHLADASVTVHPYEEALGEVRALVAAGAKVWIDPARVNYAFFAAVPTDQLVSKASPLPLAKAIKNSAELEGMRNAHVRDGAAMATFLAFLDKEVRVKKSSFTEVELDRILTRRRSEQWGFLDLSFPTIAGAGANGAIIHYRAEEGTCGTLDNSKMFLLDSGAQYQDGTTDVTRTMHFGTPPDHQKQCYTRVLQGNIGIDNTIFPDGTNGLLLDAFARKALWGAGLDYPHGTGHGVGAALNVHEGPHSISPRLSSVTALQPGMIVSNEPGYYEAGSFGIRIENLLVVKDLGITNEALGRSFYGFEALTLIPIQKHLIEVSLMTSKELDWLDDYHQQVWDKISPHVDEDTKTWLKEATSPIERHYPSDPWVKRPATAAELA